MKTLGELKTAILSWLDREDTTTIAMVPDFIRLAEADIHRELRYRGSEFTLVLTEADTPFNPIALPDAFRSAKLVRLNDTTLKQVSDAEYYTYAQANDTSSPKVFTIIDRSLYLAPWLDTNPAQWEATTLTLHYWGVESLTLAPTWDTPTNGNAVPESDGTAPETTLRTDAATTRLLQEAPDLYLFGSLIHAQMYLQNDSRVPVWEGKYRQALRSLITESRRSQYTGSSPAIKSAYGA